MGEQSSNRFEEVLLTEDSLPGTASAHLFRFENEPGPPLCRPESPALCACRAPNKKGFPLEAFLVETKMRGL